MRKRKWKMISRFPLLYPQDWSGPGFISTLPISSTISNCVFLLLLPLSGFIGLLQNVRYMSVCTRRARTCVWLFQSSASSHGIWFLSIDLGCLPASPASPAARPTEWQWIVKVDIFYYLHYVVVVSAPKMCMTIISHLEKIVIPLRI